MKTYSERTLAVVAAERQLATLSGKVLRSLMRSKKREAAQWFTHRQNKETLAIIKRVVAAHAALESEEEMPTDFYTTRYLAVVSIRLMETLESVTGDPMALFRRIRERERLMFGCFFRKDPRILQFARLDVSFGFFITTLLCLGLNYARFMLKGGIFGRALTSSRFFSGLRQEISSAFGEVPAEVSRRVAPLSRQVSRNTEAVDGLSRKFFGVVTEKGKSRTTTNAERISKAVDAYYALIKEGVKPYYAITDACRAVEGKDGLGSYKNFETYRNMVNRVIAKRKIGLR